MILDDENILIQDVIDSARYEIVDLGLSVKWADRNVGSSSPEDAGLYFQWGDTIGYTADQVDKVFNKYSYPERLNVKYNLTYGLTALESVDDAATVYMGSKYRMPTNTEIRELIYNTIQTFIDLDGHEYSIELAQKGIIEPGKLKGVRFTSSNDNSIFIPATGYYSESVLYGIGRGSGLWSSDLYGGSNNYVRSLDFLSWGSASSNCSLRYYGQSVRGVEKNLQ